MATPIPRKRRHITSSTEESEEQPIPQEKQGSEESATPEGLETHDESMSDDDEDRENDQLFENALTEIEDDESEPIDPDPEMIDGNDQPLIQQGAILRRGRKNKVYPWKEMEILYVEGEEKFTDDHKPDGRIWPTYSQMAEAYGTVPSRISEHATKHRWQEKRAAFMKRVDQERQRGRINELSREAVNIDEKSLTAAKMGISVATMRLAQMGKDLQDQTKRRQQLEQDQMPLTMSELKSAVDARELDSVASALGRFQDIARTALGEDIIRHEITSTDVSIGIDVRETMSRDDPDRIEAILKAMVEAQIIEFPDGIEDAEVLEDTEDSSDRMSDTQNDSKEIEA